MYLLQQSESESLSKIIYNSDLIAFSLLARPGRDRFFIEKLKLFGDTKRLLGYGLEYLNQDYKNAASIVYEEDKPELCRILDSLINRKKKKEKALIRIIHPNGMLKFKNVYFQSGYEDENTAEIFGYLRESSEEVVSQQLEKINKKAIEFIAKYNPEIAVEKVAKLLSKYYKIDAIVIWLVKKPGQIEGNPIYLSEDLRKKYPKIKEILHDISSPVLNSNFRIEDIHSENPVFIAFSKQKPVFIKDFMNLNFSYSRHVSTLGIKSGIIIPLVYEIDRKIAVALLSTGYFVEDIFIKKLIFEQWPSFMYLINGYLYHKEVAEINKNLEKLVSERTSHHNIILKINQRISSKLHFSEILGSIEEEIFNLIGHDLFADLFYKNQKLELVFHLRKNLSSDIISEVERKIIGVYQELSGKEVTAYSKKFYKHFNKNEKISSDELKTYSFVPVLKKYKNVKRKPQFIGLICVGSTREKAFREGDIKLINEIDELISEHIERVNKLLKSEQQRAYELVKNIDEGIIQLDKEFHIVFANSYGKRYIKLLCKVCDDGRISAIGDIDINDFFKDKSRARKQIEITKPKRRLFEIEATKIKRGIFRGNWILHIHDITEKAEMMEKIQQEQKLSAIGQLAAGIAHDFNNLLTPIIGWADLLRMRKYSALDDELKSALDTISKQGRVASGLIKQILNFTRTTTSGRSKIDLVPFIKEQIKLFERTFPENIIIEFKYKSDEPYIVHADITGLQQILTNLAVNARDAMPDGGKITISLEKVHLAKENLPLKDIPPGDWILITFSDTGHGIPNEVMNKIFTPFFTTKEKGKGTGLGLYQVYGILKQNDGYIDVESTPGKGTTFFIYLPYHEYISDQKRIEKQTIGKVKEGGTVLIVEDQDEVRTALVGMLKGLGYHVISAKDGQEGYKMFLENEGKIDVVITDWVMPDMTGVELIRKIRDRNKEVKTALMSGYPVGEKSIDMAEALNINLLLKKPISMETLSSKLSELLKT